MRHFFLILLFAAFAGVAVFTVGHAKAQPELPTVMTQLDYARLDAARAHIEQIKIAAQAQMQPFIQEESEIAARYKIKVDDIGVTVGIEKDGTIVRRKKDPDFLKPTAASSPKETP